MKILVADKFETEGLKQLEALGGKVESEPSLAGEALKEKLAASQPDILVVRSTKVPADVQDAAESLKLIIRAGSGVDNIDLDAASDRGLYVANCPGMNAVAVAELTMGLLLSVDRRIPDNVVDLRAGKWAKKEYSKARGLKGQTIGIVGAGRIGTEVALRAIAFDMKVLFTHLGRNRALVDHPFCERTDFQDLVRRSDVVTLHVPGTSLTEAMINTEVLKAMKPEAVLINTSRANIVDEAALIVALKEGWIRAAAVDVYHNEPGASDTSITSPLAELPNVYGTHHIGASTEQAQQAVAEEVVRIVAEYKKSGDVLNCVNVTQGEAACLLVVRLVNKPGSLASVFEFLRDEQINVEEMDHVIHHGGKAASAHIRLSQQPSQAVIERMRADKVHLIGVDVLPVE